jgi:hypothetical protein
MAEKLSPNRQSVRVRRSPKLSAFVGVSSAVGFFGTLIVTALFPADPSVGFGALFAYFSLYGITASVALGILVWLGLEARSRKTAKAVEMERQRS